MIIVYVTVVVIVEVIRTSLGDLSTYEGARLKLKGGGGVGRWGGGGCR